MNIIVFSRWSFPYKNPRAFRTTELIKEFKRRKTNIYGILPYSKEIHSLNLDNIILVDNKTYLDKENKKELENKSRINKIIVSIIKHIAYYLLGDSPYSILYSIRMWKKIKEDRILLSPNDVVLSISYPFYVHVAVALIMKHIHQRPLMIADCGDPFYFNPSRKIAPYLKWLEKWTLRQFDYVTIPMEEARAAYSSYGIDDRIRVIPQGFRLTEIDADEYQGNQCPTFCYAGVFYDKIRNPKYFLDYLVSQSNDFCFIVYALPDTFTFSLLKEYQKILGAKLQVREPLEREELIHVMAKMDFVVNFDNENSTQRPSKLIDYAMSKRPILSFNRKTFSPQIFQEFMNGDYKHAEHIDLSQYDIRNVVDKFEELIKEGQKKG